MDIEEVLRRLLLLGLPLIPLACDDRSLAPERDPSSIDGGTAVGTAGAGGLGGAGGLAGAGGLGGIGGQSGDGPGGFASGFVCNASVKPFDVTGSITRSDPSDLDPASWDLCAGGGDCTMTCKDVAWANGAFGIVNVQSCERVQDGGVDDRADDGSPGDPGRADSGLAGDDGGDDASTSVAITLHVKGTSTYGCTGRRPEGLIEGGAPARGTLAGRWLAQAAALEAASVPAFRRLARELHAHGAPERLVLAAREAVAEEQRHTLLMARAARKRGAAPRRARVAPLRVRPLLAVAIENAREGCTRETMGALVAVHQATRAADPALRAAFSEIARDESRHARLAWEVDAWARSVLPPEAARLVDDARRQEGARLVAELERGAAMPELARELGLPSPAAARSQARRALRLLWTA